MSADSIVFSNLNVTDAIATASRPGSSEIESADDFVLTDHVAITHATFIGLVVGASGPISNSTISDLNLEIYRVFPKDSTVPPSGNVPTRNNSPSDVAFDERNGSGIASTTVTSLSSSFAALNSVENGIDPKNLHTGGEGGVTGEEVQFDVTFATPFDLEPDHYFFVPQVGLSDGTFFWLSASRPISGGTPFPPGFMDLQEWIRNEALQPDWLRVGTDIVGGSPAPTFNNAFALEGHTVPEPATLLLLGGGLVGAAARARRKKAPKH